MQKSHLCKKKLLTIITHILLRNCYEIWFRDLYLQFFLRNTYILLLSFFQKSVEQLYFTLQPPAIFSSIFFHYTSTNYTQNISSYYTYITPQFVHTYTLSYILPTLYIRKKRKNIENLKIFYIIILFTLFTSNFSMILYIYDIWVTRKQNRHFELYYSLLDCKGLV